jgi:glycosyltransferase involved in cell wall biosynthesis
MIRVLHIISGLGSGGTEGVLARLVSSSGGELVSGVVSLTDDGIHGAPTRAAGIPVWVARMPGGLPTLGYRRALRSAVKEFRPDVVCGWLYRGNMAALSASRDAGGVPIVWNIRHSLHDWERERFLFRLTVRANLWKIGRPDLVIYNSQAARDQHRDFGFIPRKDMVIPNGFDLNRFRPDSEARRALRAEWALEEDQIAVGLVARWHPVKNHSGFLEAAAAGLKSYPRTVFILAGDGCDSSNSELVGLISRWGLGQSVRMLGRVGAVERVTAALDLAVNASFGEAFSNAVGEALACGVPCLATAVGDSRRIVGENGWCVEPGALAEGLTAVLASGREGLAAKARGARQRMESEYRLDIMNEKFAEAFRTVKRRSE